MAKSTKKTTKKKSGKRSGKKSGKSPKNSTVMTARILAKKINPKFEEKTTLDTAYLTNNSDAAITLEIILGAPGQTGVTDIILDKVHIITAEKGSLPEFALGTNKKLSGKTMMITTVVSDTSKETNYCESIIRIRGGIRFSEYTLFKKVPNEGDEAIFTSSIEFFKI